MSITFKQVRNIPDEEGDMVRICSDEELSIALKEMNSHYFKKLFITGSPQEGNGSNFAFILYLLPLFTDANISLPHLICKPPSKCLFLEFSPVIICIFCTVLLLRYDY